MPAVSKKQQRFFGIVRAIQKGEMSPTTPETAKAAADMKKSDVKDFASTKHKKLPEKVVAKEESNPRIPRKKGQPANSKKHSDLYTDENPKGTIHGLGFKDVADELNAFLQTSPEPGAAITMFLDTIANKVVELGNAIRFAWFEVRDIQASGKWIQREPYDVLKSLCKNYDADSADV